MLRIDDVIAKAQEYDCSDIHVSPNSRVLFRINGLLEPTDVFGIVGEEEVLRIVHMLCDEAKKEVLQLNDEVSLNYSPAGLKRSRIHIIKQRGTYSLTIRLLKYGKEYSRSGLLPGQVYDLTTQTRGLFIVSGASGSGKSSHLAGILQHINRTQKLSILTVEDNIEYYFENDQALVVQREVGMDCRSMEDGLRNSIRHDPDVIFISDLSEPAVLDIALRLAASGKLVLGGLLGINSVSTLDILLRTGENRQSIANSLIGILSLQLVPSKNNHDRELVYELLIANQLIRNAVVENRLFDIKKIVLDSQKQGMCNMDVNMYEIYRKGQITKETLYKYCHDPELVKRLEREQMIKG